jgi:NADH dehydrogenase (ubiquinone) Fe-S protein 5
MSNALFDMFRANFQLQIARAKAIKEEFVKKVQHQAAEGRKIADVLADGVITGVGLIQRDGGKGK